MNLNCVVPPVTSPIYMYLTSNEKCIHSNEDGSGHPVPTKAFLLLGMETALLFSPSGKPAYPPSLSADAEPQGHCQKWHHKMKLSSRH